MNVLIFAAGLGTRLKPLTDTMPKALVPVQGTPLLRILIGKLKRSLSVNETMTSVINVHHFADQITCYLKENDNFGIDIRISDETDMLLDTGGGIKKALRMFDDSSPVLAHNVDILSNLDIAGFYRKAGMIMAGDKSGIGAVLKVSRRESSRYLLFDEDNRLRGWTNANTGEIKTPYPSLDVSGLNRFAFSGIQVVNPELLIPMMEEWHGKYSIIDFYLSVCDKIDIICEPDDELFLVDVGKLETLNYLCKENLELLT